MKAISFMIIMFSNLIALQAQETDKFELYFSTYNHAEGIVDSYKITDKEIVVSVKALIEERDSIVYTSKIRQDVIEKIKSINFQSLESYYYNNCILATSGKEYFIGFRYGIILKRISLHHYYQKNIGYLIELINLSVPGEYYIDYVEADTEQGCP